MTRSATAVMRSSNTSGDYAMMRFRVFGQSLPTWSLLPGGSSYPVGRYAALASRRRGAAGFSMAFPAY